MTTFLLLRHATRPFASLAPLAGSTSAAAARRLIDAERRLAAGAARLDEALHRAAGAKREGLDAESARRRLAILAVKRAVHNRRTPAPDDLAVAVAALDSDSVAALDAHARALEESAEAEHAWRDALALDLAVGRQALIAATRDPLVAMGIALAGRALAAKIGALARVAAASWGHGDRHVAAKALAYVARFATKTSPNSLFCATGIARAEGREAALDGEAAIGGIDLILSVAEARKIACVLAVDPEVEAAIVPRPNPTLREEDGAFVVWRFASVRNAGDDEALSRVKDHPVLRLALEDTAARVSLPELRRRVAARCGFPEEAVGAFLAQLIDRGLLVGEIEIPYNERRPLRFVAERALAAGCSPAWAPRALAVERDVDRLAGVDGEDRLRAMDRITSALRDLPHTRPLKEDELFRLDAASALRVSLPEALIGDLRAGLRPYTRLFAALYPARRYLQGWVDRFLAKFPADAEIELTDVYRSITEQDDTYRPAAFPEPAGAGLEGADPARRAMAAVTEHLANAAREAGPGDEIPLDDAALERLVPGAPDPRWACGVLFQVAAPSVDAIARGEHRLVLNGLFHGAGLSLSRFAHLLGGGARDDANPVVRELRRAWSVLNRPGAIVAELTYNHLGRTANAGLRPSIFEHEIELPGDCASPGVAVLGLRDLTVRWDTDADRFLLRRRSDGTEVLPVINSGVNPVGFVSFLVAVGEQTLQPLAYFPGFDAPDVTHWPRVVSGRLTLFRERWVFRRGDWPEAPARGDDPVPFARAAVAWRARWALPRHVFVHTSTEPKPRYVDLDAPLFLDLLRRDLAAIGPEPGATLHVTEMFPGPDDLFARGAASEFLVQLNG